LLAAATSLHQLHHRGTCSGGKKRSPASRFRASGAAGEIKHPSFPPLPSNVRPRTCTLMSDESLTESHLQVAWLSASFSVDAHHLLVFLYMAEVFIYCKLLFHVYIIGNHHTQV
jgi:hypothetical protein